MPKTQHFDIQKRNITGWDTNGPGDNHTHTHHSYILWQDFIHIMGRYYSKFNTNTVITTFRAGKYLSLLWHDTKGTCISWRWISVGMIQLELYCHLDVIKINQLLVCMRWTQLCILQNVCQVPYNSLWLKTLPSITILSHYKWHTTLQLQYLSEMKEQMSSSRIYWTAAHQYIYMHIGLLIFRLLPMLLLHFIKSVLIIQSRDQTSRAPQFWAFSGIYAYTL